ncbi:UNVERIFIED_CONTAM: hypothetical protein FKN15_013023 [Acipenser sinensis]
MSSDTLTDSSTGPHGEDLPWLPDSQVEQLKVFFADSVKDIKGALSELSIDVKAIRNDMDLIWSRLQQVEKEVSTLTSSIQTHGKRTDILKAAQRQNRDSIKDAKADITQLQARLAELEDRNRRSNLRLVGLPEGEEGDDPISFLQHNLPLWFPSLPSKGVIEIERAHRIYSGANTQGNKPRTLIFKLLRYNDRQAILKAYRQPGTQISQGQSKLLLFPDYSNFTAEHRKAFAPIQSSLKQMGIQSFLLYPSKLKIVHNGQSNVYSTPQDAQQFVLELKRNA